MEETKPIVIETYEFEYRDFSRILAFFLKLLH